MNSTPVKIFGISNCDTMKKARVWLTEHDIDYELHDYKKAGLEENTLRKWIAVVGWETLLNRRGTTWRKAPEKIRQGIDEPSAIDLMLKNLSMIKRPVLIRGDNIVVGFKPDDYAKLFK